MSFPKRHNAVESGGLVPFLFKEVDEDSKFQLTKLMSF